MAFGTRARLGVMPSRPVPLHPTEGDGLSQATQALRCDAQPASNMMLPQPPVQVRLSADEIPIAFHRVVVPEGDFVRLLLDDPMAFHVADVEGRDLRILGNELFESRELVFE